MKKYLNLTFLEFIEKLLNQKKEIDKDQIGKIIDTYNNFANDCHIMPTLFILNYCTQKFALVSDNVKKLSGYDVSLLREEGLPFFLNIINKNDFAVYNEKIFPQNINFLNKTPQQEHSSYVFSHDYRIISKDNHTIRLHQRNTYITAPETGIPILNIGMVTNISLFKKDSTILHQIEKITPDGDENEMLYSETYYPEGSLFTKREIEVLKWLAEGLNTLEISHKLVTAESTISNHRKSMMEKSNSKNVAQLITYSIRNNIL